MPYYLSPQTFKRQAKILVQHWPFGAFKTNQARELLSQLYGYQNHHHYQGLLLKPDVHLLPIRAETVLNHYRLWVKQLADLGSMNQIQARQVLHRLWPAYLGGQVALNDKLYQASIHFHGSCLDFLGGSHAKTSMPLCYAFDDRPAIKDVIEALGVPHPEVGAIRINQHWQGLDYLLMDQDQVAVFSHTDPVYSLCHKPLPYKPKKASTFLLDVHLGGLARYLRMAGFDCLHEGQDCGDALLAEIAAQNDYILLTRDIGLLKRAQVRYGHWVRAVLPEQQFREIVEYYQLKADFKPFSRCIRCNGAIIAVDKVGINGLVPEKIYRELMDFRQCQQCQQVYWKGSHYEKIQQILAHVSQ